MAVTRIWDAINGMWQVVGGTVEPSTGGDHGWTHTPGSIDPLDGGFLNEYLKMDGTAEDLGDASVGPSYETGASLTFTKPPAWVTFLVMAWGSVMFRADQAALGAARVAIIGDEGPIISVPGVSGTSGVTVPLTVNAVHRRTGLTAGGVISVRYAEPAPTVEKRASAIQYIAMRTS